jgi:undecaprenyl-diphosphatase
MSSQMIRKHTQKNATRTVQNRYIFEKGVPGMSSLEVILLALIQGVTEFFPVSSSAHLILGRWLLGWQDPGLFMDVAVHVGTLGAVLVYFSRDVGRLLRGGVSLVRGRITGDTHFFLTLALATVPLVAIGFMVDRWGGDRLRTMEVLGWSTLFFGCLMYGAALLK